MLQKYLTVFSVVISFPRAVTFFYSGQRKIPRRKTTRPTVPHAADRYLMTSFALSAAKEKRATGGPPRSKWLSGPDLVDSC